MDEDDDEPVPLPNVNAAILAKVNTVHHRYSLFIWSLCHLLVLKGFHLNGYTGFHPQTQIQNYILNKWYHMKVLLKRFHLNGHTVQLRPQTQR